MTCTSLKCSKSPFHQNFHPLCMVIEKAFVACFSLDQQSSARSNVFRKNSCFITFFSINLPSDVVCPGRMVYFARLLGLVLATDLALTTRRWKLSTLSSLIFAEVSSFSCFPSVSFSSVAPSFSWQGLASLQRKFTTWESCAWSYNKTEIISNLLCTTV